MENQPQNSAPEAAAGIPKKYWYLGGLLLALILFWDWDCGLAELKYSQLPGERQTRPLLC